MKKFLFLSFSLFHFSLLIISCHCKRKTASPQTAIVVEEKKRDFAQEGYTKATVINYEMDGCKYILQ